VIALLLLAAVLQDGPWTTRPAAPTVGDTIRLERFVPTPQGASGRTQPLEARELLEPLEPPDIRPAAGGLRVRHTVALFMPGLHALAMPSIEVLHPDGTVELIDGDTAIVAVAAVIPDSVTAPQPQPSQAPLSRPIRQPWRAAVPVAAAAALLSLWLLWLRRAPGRAAVALLAAKVPEPPLMRWLGTGERRAVATLAALRLRRAVAARLPAAAPGLALDAWRRVVAESRPDWPEREWLDILAALERARFAPLGADDLAELVDRVDQAVARLAAEADAAVRGATP
jgi:hypothetical protein